MATLEEAVAEAGPGKHAVYFDPEDAAMDGFGWNVVLGLEGGIAARFATEAEARDAAVEWDED